MGCDWQNVPLHLPHTFTAIEQLTNSKHLRVAMMGEHGLAWPWESLHIEALAWFDHWLKDQDTGILEGPRFRYVLPEAEGWRTSDAWPIQAATHLSYALRADASLGEDEGEAGSRTYMNLGGGLNRPRPSETDPPGLSGVDDASSFSQPGADWRDRATVGRRLHCSGHCVHRRAAGRGRKRERRQRHCRISSRVFAEGR